MIIAGNNVTINSNTTLDNLSLITNEMGNIYIDKTASPDIVRAIPHSEQPRYVHILAGVSENVVRQIPGSAHIFIHAGVSPSSVAAIQERSPNIYVYIPDDVAAEAISAIPLHVRSINIIWKVTADAVRAIPQHVELVYISEGASANAVRAIPRHVRMVHIRIRANINAIIATPDYVQYIMFDTLPDGFIEAMNNNLIPQNLIIKALNLASDDVRNLYENRMILAHILAGSPEGSAILAAHDNQLARLLTAETLNAQAYPEWPGFTLSNNLAESLEGQAILAAHDNDGRAVNARRLRS